MTRTFQIHWQLFVQEQPDLYRLIWGNYDGDTVTLFMCPHNGTFSALASCHPRAVKLTAAQAATLSGYRKDLITL
jgi:hypothetical protein